MKNYLTALCLALALCAALPGDALAQKKNVPLKIKGDTYLVVKSVPFDVEAPEGAGDYSWTMPAGVEGTESDDGHVLTVTKAPAGSFLIRVKMTTIDFEKKKIVKDTGEITVMLGAGPDPGPGPQPGPSPIEGDGFRVLIVYESKDKLPSKQQAILTSATIRAYLDIKCTKDPTVDTWKAYRIWDKDVDTSNEHKSWQNAMKRPRQSTPWIIISTGKGGYEGPLPADMDATLTLLKKYGGD